MTIPTALRRIPAIAIAGIFTYGGLRLVLGESLMSPSTWTDYQIITILLIAGTIGAGHYTKTAALAGAWLSCIGFAAVFLTGTWLAARQSLDRQVETTANVQLSAEATNKALAEKAIELTEAKTRLKYAEDRFEQESTGQKCLDRCENWRRTAADRRTVVAAIEAQIAKLGPSKPVKAGAAYFGDVAAALGFDRAGAISFDALLTPFLKFFVFEIGSIVSLGFALRHAPAAASQIAATTASSATDKTETFADPAIVAERLPTPTTFSGERPEPTPPLGGRKPNRKTSTANVLQFPAKHPVVRALENVGGSVASNAELALLMGVSDGESSKRWKEIAALLDVTKVGKHVQISLRKDAREAQSA